MTMRTNAVTVGAPVRTAEGKGIGNIAELSGTCFRMDVPLRPDYWLSMDLVNGFESDGTVILTINRDELDVVKQDKPGHIGHHHHT
jgi:hypothetical protein